MMKTFALACIALLALSCSDDDNNDTDAGGGSGNGSTASFVSLSVGNEYNYDVTQGTMTDQDRLEITSESGTGAMTTREFTADQPATGFMSQALNGNSLREDAGVLYIDGSIGLAIPNLGNGLGVIDLNNAVLYDAGAAVGTTLSTQSGTNMQTIQGFDVDINYTVSTIQRETLPSVTVNGVTYQDAIRQDIVINLELVTNISVGIGTIPVTILSAQDVIVLENTWGGDTGLLRSDATIEYMLEDFSSFGIALPFPDAAMISVEQILTSATIN